MSAPESHGQCAGREGIKVMMALGDFAAYIKTLDGQGVQLEWEHSGFELDSLKCWIVVDSLTGNILSQGTTLMEAIDATLKK